ncbi:MAG: SH3 domain-containing protein [Clostridia bacterium]|nr:SH3 domain-containing protein [Clostridia bacterium]
MKFLGKFCLFLVIVVPIIICFVTLNNIWKEDDTGVIKGVDSESNNVIAGNDVTNENGGTTTPQVTEQTYQMGSEEFKSAIGAPTSKIIEGATINISVANVYLNPDENSEVVDTITKHTVVTTQSFPDGWSRIKSSSTVSGWVRTENITLPADSGDVSVGSVVGRSGKVNVTSLNVRASASTTATIKNTLTENTEVKILEISGDGNWYRVQWQSLEGWVSSKYITLQ